jgi:hypothetical protein
VGEIGGRRGGLRRGGIFRRGICCSIQKLRFGS